LNISIATGRCNLAATVAWSTGVPPATGGSCRLIKDDHLPLSEPKLCFASSEIETHLCVKCQAPMVLIRVNTARLIYDVRTFECFNCDNVDKVMTETKRESAAFPLPHR
jgi:hypothetical protein